MKNNDTKPKVDNDFEKRTLYLYERLGLESDSPYQETTYFNKQFKKVTKLRSKGILFSTSANTHK